MHLAGYVLGCLTACQKLSGAKYCNTARIILKQILAIQSLFLIIKDKESAGRLSQNIFLCNSISILKINILYC